MKKLYVTFPENVFFFQLFLTESGIHTVGEKNDLNDISVAIDSESVHQKRMLSIIIVR